MEFVFKIFEQCAIRSRKIFKLNNMRFIREKYAIHSWKIFKSCAIHLQKIFEQRASRKIHLCKIRAFFASQSSYVSFAYLSRRFTYSSWINSVLFEYFSWMIRIFFANESCVFEYFSRKNRVWLKYFSSMNRILFEYFSRINRIFFANESRIIRAFFANDSNGKCLRRKKRGFNILIILY